MLFLEWCSFKLADVVLSSNETFRQIAFERGGKRPDVVHVVHTIPDFSHLRRVDPDQRLRGGRRLVVGYMGIIGVQDGLDHLVRATQDLVKRHGLRDFRVIVIGDGPARSEEHTSELQSLMRISYAVFCLKKNKNTEKTLT